MAVRDCEEAVVSVGSHVPDWHGNEKAGWMFGQASSGVGTRDRRIAAHARPSRRRLQHRADMAFRASATEYGIKVGLLF